MLHKVTIREYAPSDKPQLLEVLKLNVPKYFAENEIKDFDVYLETKIEKYFVVELESKVIGSGGINFDKEYKNSKISWDFIHPDFQGKGIGTKLLQHRIIVLKSIKSIESISVRTSQQAFQFYEKNDFILNEIVKDYWAKGYDLYSLTLKDSHL